MATEYNTLGRVLYRVLYTPLERARGVYNDTLLGKTKYYYVVGR
jgi:hypothetical protein